MNQIPLKAHYVSGALEGLAEFSSSDKIGIDYLGLRLDAWLDNQTITNMTYDIYTNLEWVYFSTNHKQQMFYDYSNDDRLTHVDYYLDVVKISTLNITYDVGGNLISTTWVDY